MRKFITGIFLICVYMLNSCSHQSKWILLHPATTPPPTASGGFAYNIKSNEGVIFGGLYKDRWSDDTWLWDGNNWRKID